MLLHLRRAPTSFLGFLHMDNYNKPSLVFDLIEPFRILAERATVLLFTGRRVRSEFFESVPGGVALSKEGSCVRAFLPYAATSGSDRPVQLIRCNRSRARLPQDQAEGDDRP